jgi:hypothetical protein
MKEFAAEYRLRELRRETQREKARAAAAARDFRVSKQIFNKIPKSPIGTTFVSF